MQEVADAIKSAGGRASAFPCDVSAPAQVQATADVIGQALGQVHILVNNAGIPAPRTFAETNFSDWDAVIGTNLSGVFYLTRALWDALIAAESATVITISGTAGLRGGGSPAYGGAKFGLTGLNHAIAQAGKDHGIRATILYPRRHRYRLARRAHRRQPRSETMDPAVIARMIGQMVVSPPEFVVNEAVLNPLDQPYM